MTKLKDSSIFWALIITFLLLSLMLWKHQWQAPKPAKAVKVSETLPDFAKYASIKEKKAAFFAYIRPLVQQQNRKIKYDQAFLEKIAEDLQTATHHQTASLRKLKKLAKVYHLEFSDVEQVIDELRLRIEPVPDALVLVQAANESAWGTSRFAREANNLFGQWCYKPGCGVVPNGRKKGAKHQVRLFDSPKLSVASYMKNLNSHAAYQEFRQLRHRLKSSGQRVTAIRLAPTLERYSERGTEYVEELITMIKQNRLE
ncbi:glucosaminidase domain-containing protein [Aliikangiella coralliicola]|uniref:Mannosyl-glycoprotein endo-beta-N-acetylglucosamidase-like domain-containing protein n=1 Tax=Aliikangiella coralliicola TaxID=2592383 RepID=A0A545UDI6_9GAMM|nr:glucosaminidase domain-containing protein [Aliikangiella coralliicola]TQV87520.1 hypothetical protein FLL46_11640 [Aliikangiella coralliicola]